MSVTDEQKLDVIIAHLTDVIDGGYPGESLWIGDTLAYTRKAMLAWYDRAAALVEDDPGFEMSDALYETA